MKFNISLLVSGLLLLVGSSCQKWLNIQPEDRYTDDQVYSTASGYEEALNGVYIGMSSDNLYGRNLTLTVPDVLAQYYKTNLNTSHPFYALGNYNYGDESVTSRTTAIWTQAYVVIANINKLLENIDSRGDQVLSNSRLRTMKGELLGLRGFVHFDLLRFFGPVYDSADSAAMSIPYYRKVSSEAQPFLPANQVMRLVLDDFNQALQYLDADPIKTEGYGNKNNQRFNYYAVQASKARALLWRKDLTGAHKAALEVVNASNLFPWVVGTNVTASANPDYIFRSELLFTVYSNNLYTNYNQYFYYELQEDDILAGGSAAYINKVFESKAGDYRNTPMWIVPPRGVSFPTFFKYADTPDKDRGRVPHRNLIPLIRLSEMYYILAETEVDEAIALPYLNTVLNHRGVASLESGNINLQEEIMKEYRKEFYGEGQLWYYYKRKGISSVLSALTSTNVGTIPSSAWILPIPNEEIKNR